MIFGTLLIRSLNFMVHVVPSLLPVKREFETQRGTRSPPAWVVRVETRTQVFPFIREKTVGKERKRNSLDPLKREKLNNENLSGLPSLERETV